MRLRLLAALAGLAIATGAAQAQIGIYTTPLVSRISNSTADTGVFAFLGPNSKARIFEGFGVGVYDDLYHSGRLSVGGDVRLDLMRGGGAQLTNFLLGGRVAFQPETLRIKPYFDILGGVASTRPAHNPRSVSKPEYSISAGVDYPLNKHVDFRMIEVGYASVQTINSSTVNTQATALPAAKLINLSTGLVFRIP